MSSSTFGCDLSGWFLIEYIFYCHILWWIFYYFLLLVTKQSEEWCCRALTFVHGCMMSYAAIKDVIVNKYPIDFNSIPLSQTKRQYLSCMLSYFLFDFCWIHFFGNETWIIYAHHASSILIIIYVFLRNFGGNGVSYGVAGLELSNPYLQSRWFLRTHGYLNRPVHTITELWFMFLFFSIRIIGGTVLLYYGMRRKTDFGIKLSILSIYGISLVLQWQIFVYFRKKYLHGGGIRGVNFIHSRVSISPYFQRMTLDNPDDRKARTSGETETVVMPVSSTLTTEVFAAKEAESTEKSISSAMEESSKTKFPETERNVVSVMKEQIPEESPEEVAEESPEGAAEDTPEEPDKKSETEPE